MVEIIKLFPSVESEPFHLRRSASVSEMRASSPVAPILPSLSVERISLLCPAPTFVNEQNVIRLALMIEVEPCVIFCSDGFVAVPTKPYAAQYRMHTTYYMAI